MPWTLREAEEAQPPRAQRDLHIDESSLSGLAHGGFSTELRLLLVDLASEEGHDVENLDVGVGFVAFELQALKVRHTLGTGGQHRVGTGGTDFFHAGDTEGASVLVARHHAGHTTAHGVLAAVLHLHDLDALNGVDEFTRLVVDAHLAAESARVVVGDRRVVGLEVHVEALLDEELRRVHDLDVLEFVVSSEGSETLGTGGHEGVDAGLVDLALVVRLQLLKDLVQALPLLVVATALEEVSTEVGHVGAHFLEEGEGSRRGVAEVHGALVDVGEDHLLVEVVDTAGVVADVGGDGVVLGGDEISISGFLGLSVEHGLKHGVRESQPADRPR